MQNIKAIIFDFDGVLADSELLANQIEVDLKNELGFQTNLEDQINKFTGMAMNDPVMVQELKRLPKNYWNMVDDRLLIAIQTELRTTPQVYETLDKLQLPMSIASNSELDWLKMKVQILKLEPYFSTNVFSREQVNKGKPAPDLFLHAAQKMNVSPESCLVIEDSCHGIAAARAANMPVIGYTGASHVTDSYRQKIQESKPDKIINNISDILQLINSAEFYV